MFDSVGPLPPIPEGYEFHRFRAAPCQPKACEAQSLSDLADAICGQPWDVDAQCITPDGSTLACHLQEDGEWGAWK